MQIGHRQTPHQAPDASLADGLLTCSQIVELGRIRLGLSRIKEAIERINNLAADTGLPLRQVPEYPLALLANDISQLAFAHEQAEKRIKEAAFAAAERLAA